MKYIKEEGTLYYRGVSLPPFHAINLYVRKGGKFSIEIIVDRKNVSGGGAQIHFWRVTQMNDLRRVKQYANRLYARAIECAEYMKRTSIRGTKT